MTAEQQTRLEAIAKNLEVIAKEPELIAAVKEANAQLGGPSKPNQEMIQEVWKTLSVRDPKVRKYSENVTAKWLKSKVKAQSISEAFVSARDGTKVAFLEKTTNWNHTGKPKHEVPMKGKPWRGVPELDESSGHWQIQLSFPVLEGPNSIGSIVFGVPIGAFN